MSKKLFQSTQFFYLGDLFLGLCDIRESRDRIIKGKKRSST